MPWNQAALFAILAVAIVAGSPAHAAEPRPPAPNYDDGAAWLCRPGRADACARTTTATIFAGGGGTRVATYAPDPHAPIDCFYVYPTVSRAATMDAPIVATEDEIGAARRQLARFTTVCRPFAPLYRQVTRAGLHEVFDGDPTRVDREAPYADVKAAWARYLAQDNHGRGIVLIGHSQGSKLLARLLAEEIDGRPIAKQLIVAIIPGTEVDVPPGATVGGSLRHIPLCTSATQIGCVIAYSSYSAGEPMRDDAHFGSAKAPGQQYACVNPAALAGTPTLDADLPLSGDLAAKYGTDFAELPGLISASCTLTGRFSILAIKVPPESRAGETAAALVAKIGQDNHAWGLHAIDLNLALGTLVKLVHGEAATYAKR